MGDTVAGKITRGELIVALMLCVIFAYIAAFAHLVMIDLNATVDIERNHAQVLQGTASSPLQYRPGAYLLALGIQNLVDGNVIRAYYIERIIFTFTTGFLAFLLFRRFSNSGWAFAGLGWMFAVMPFTYLGYNHQPADPVNATFYLLGYLAASYGATLWLIPIAAMGVFFRETAILIPLFGLISDYVRRGIMPAIARFVFACVAAAAVIFAIHRFYGPREHPDTWIMIADNLRDLRWMQYLVILAGIPAGVALWGRRGLNQFAKQGLLFTLIFLVIHFIFGRFSETRLYLPVMPLLILAALQGMKHRTGALD